MASKSRRHVKLPASGARLVAIHAATADAMPRSPSAVTASCLDANRAGSDATTSSICHAVPSGGRASGVESMIQT